MSNSLRINHPRQLPSASSRTEARARCDIASLFDAPVSAPEAAINTASATDRDAESDRQRRPLASVRHFRLAA